MAPRKMPEVGLMLETGWLLRDKYRDSMLALSLSNVFGLYHVLLGFMSNSFAPRAGGSILQEIKFFLTEETPCTV